ncbi:hypothetical protein AJ80_10038, partial [Polytolypa hystricis UAMH7299]
GLNGQKWTLLALLLAAAALWCTDHYAMIGKLSNAAFTKIHVPSGTSLPWPLASSPSLTRELTLPRATTPGCIHQSPNSPCEG